MPALFRIIALLAMVGFFFISCNKRSGKPRVLVFTKTAGYHHESIPSGVAAIEKLGSENNFDVDTTSNAEMFTEDTLKKYAAVVFLSTTGDVLNNYEEADFERYIQAGGGYMGIHAAADCEYDWGWYGRLVGGYFLVHPGIKDSFPNVQTGVLNVVDQNNPATKDLPKEWKRTDEFYSFKKLNKDVHVLMTIDENSYHISTKMPYHPMTWYHEYDGGRAFYTALGHTKESFTEEPYLKLILGGIKYAIGDNKELDYSKAKTARVPDENRFTKTQLVTGTFFEPTEMTILPNLDVLVAQRRGELYMYKNATGTVKQVGFLNVYFKTLHTPGVNAEEGFLGLKADPNFAKNHYIYAFYSPADTSVNRLSRFTFDHDTLDMKSEKVILQFYSQREICCHTGGSIAFDGKGNLFVSTGDNSTPFDEKNQPYANHGFAPLDDRPGHEQYDSRRTAGNSNDLRGKILRIHVNEDGTYTIPDGNLYPKGMAKTRPEIYVQGDRNPYRISVDPKNGYLYWGEVGPDASNDSLDTRGPRGYDEFNQARKAGFFGWPLFIGNNYAYRAHDYNTNADGAPFDPAHPINNSRNNTGIQELPPAQPAFIWYPYGPSSDFPQLGSGGRCAMAGPAYYTDMFPKETRLPDYYNNKLFIYEWMRNWIKVVTMQPNGDFDKMEPFMEHTKLNNVVDMEVGPDGKLYLLEYGSGWFSKNPDAGLSRIDFNAGNRPPVVADLEVNQTSGAVPFTVVATVKASDPERDPLTYTWDLGNGVKKETKEPRLDYTFDKVGDYAISVEVKDNKNASAKSNVIPVYAGNDAPVLSIDIKGNKEFYFPDKPVAYAVSVSDKNDPSVASDTKDIFVSADYMEGSDKAGASPGHKVVSEAIVGKSLTQTLDCKGCHKEAEKSIGPAFTDVSKKYQNDPGAVTHLVNKIMKGGSGVWGEVVMPAHPNLAESDAREIVSYVLSLAGAKAQKSMPAAGSVKPTLDKKPSDNGVFILTASYTDKGGPGVKPLTGTATTALKSSKMGFASASHVEGFNKMSFNGMALMIVPKSPASVSLDSLDLTGVRGIDIGAGFDKAPLYGYDFELHLDQLNGPKIGQGMLPAGANGVKGPGGFNAAVIHLTMKPVEDGKLHSLYLVSKLRNPAAEKGTLALTSLQLKAK